MSIFMKEMDPIDKEELMLIFENREGSFWFFISAFYPHDMDSIHFFYDQINFKLLSTNEDCQFSTEMLECFENEWDWIALSENKGIGDEEFMKSFIDVHCAEIIRQQKLAEEEEEFSDDEDDDVEDDEPWEDLEEEAQTVDLFYNTFALIVADNFQYGRIDEEDIKNLNGLFSPALLLLIPEMGSNLSFIKKHKELFLWGIVNQCIDPIYCIDDYQHIIYNDLIPWDAELIRYFRHPIIGFTEDHYFMPLINSKLQAYLKQYARKDFVLECCEAIGFKGSYPSAEQACMEDYLQKHYGSRIIPFILPWEGLTHWGDKMD